MLTTAFLGNRALKSAIGKQYPYNMINESEPDLRLPRVIGAGAFTQTEAYSKKLE